MKTALPITIIDRNDHANEIPLSIWDEAVRRTDEWQRGWESKEEFQVGLLSDDWVVRVELLKEVEVGMYGRLTVFDITLDDELHNLTLLVFWHKVEGLEEITTSLRRIELETDSMISVVWSSEPTEHTDIPTPN